MAKSSRASRIKKNNQALSKRVFGPVETARNERLSAKLLELAKTPKEREEEMEVEKQADGTTEAAAKTDDVDMDESVKARKSNREIKRKNEERAARIEKKSHKKARNMRRFPTASKKKGSKR